MYKHIRRLLFKHCFEEQILIYVLMLYINFQSALVILLLRVVLILSNLLSTYVNKHHNTKINFIYCLYSLLGGNAASHTEIRHKQTNYKAIGNIWLVALEIAQQAIHGFHCLIAISKLQ